MKKKNLIVCFIIFSVVLSVSSTARADLIPATGQLPMTISSYSGTTTGVLVDLGSGPVSTGLISYSVDQSFGQSNFFNIDWDSGTAAIDFNLLVTFPLLDDLGIIDPIELRITESGSVDTIPLVEPGATNVGLSVSTMMIGGGTVTDGLFAGCTFENDNNWFSPQITVNVGANGNTMQIGSDNVSSSHTGTVTQPGDTPQPTSGSGSGTVTPEPASLTLALIGLGYTSWRLRRRKALR